MHLSEADFQQLRALSSELHMLLERVQPVPNLDLDDLVASTLSGQTEVSASVIRRMYPGYGRAAIHASLQRLGWKRYRTSRSRTWVAPIHAHASAAVST